MNNTLHQCTYPAATNAPSFSPIFPSVLSPLPASMEDILFISLFLFLLFSLPHIKIIRGEVHISIL